MSRLYRKLVNKNRPTFTNAGFAAFIEKYCSSIVISDDSRMNIKENQQQWHKDVHGTEADGVSSDSDSGTSSDHGGPDPIINQENFVKDLCADISSVLSQKDAEYQKLAALNICQLLKIKKKTRVSIGI